MVLIEYRPPGGERLAAAGFVVEYYLNVVELHRRGFATYRLALDFARRKAGRDGAIFDNVPEFQRSMGFRSSVPT